jgi:response regulator of citrate/malate metabolism
MAPLELEPEIAQKTISDLLMLVEHLKRDRAAVDLKIQEIESRIEMWTKLSSPKPQSSGIRRGEVKDTVLGILQAHPQQKFTVKELADETTYGWTSVKSALDNAKKAGKVESADGKWWWNITPPNENHAPKAHGQANLHVLGKVSA